MKVLIFLFVIPFYFGHSYSLLFPPHWWEKVPESQRSGSWEILPHEAKEGELILSKRNELGVFSNLGKAKFFLDEEEYYSIEGLWQMMKYPANKSDLRWTDEFIYTRAEVKKLSGFEAKKAGDMANKILKRKNINWISYKREIFNYKDHCTGSDFHYNIIYDAIKAKITQNPNIKKLLLKTKDLKLMPDHKIKKNSPKSYFYHDILMKIRSEI